MALFDATFIALCLLVIGVPFLLPLAVITFIGAFIPLIGATVAGLLAVLVALGRGRGRVPVGARDRRGRGRDSETSPDTDLMKPAPAF